MTDTSPQPSVEERVARHLASKDWLTTPDRWDTASAWFRADYLAFAREVIALVQPDAPASAPTDWIDGHPQLEAIAAAVWERCGRSDSGGCVEDDPRNIAVAALAAVLPVSGDRAAIERVRSVLEFEAVVGRSALDYRGLITTALMADQAPASGPGGVAGETPQPDPAAPELTAEEARALVDQMGLDLYRAQDAIEFARECCDIADREQRPVTTADVREWLKGDRCTRQRAADEVQQPETQADEPPVVCQGFVWIGQSFATCDRCGQPAWDHAGRDAAVAGAGPFDTRRTVVPWGPGEADRIRAKWGPAAVSQPDGEA